MSLANARHILVSSEEQCLDLKKQIEDGADFADIARKHSSCPSSHQGGDLGQFGRGEMVKEFDEVVFSADITVITAHREGNHNAFPGRDLTGSLSTYGRVSRAVSQGVTSAIIRLPRGDRSISKV